MVSDIVMHVSLCCNHVHCDMKSAVNGILAQYILRIYKMIQCLLLSTDPTLTLENVIGAMEKVSVDKRRHVWKEVLERRVVEEIYNSNSSEEEKLHSCADSYTSKPDSSWEDLVRWLYVYGEMAVAKKAKSFLQQKGEWLIV